MNIEHLYYQAMKVLANVAELMSEEYYDFKLNDLRVAKQEGNAVMLEDFIFQYDQY